MNFNQLFQKMRELDQPVAEEKQADKDYDGDGEVESGKDEYMDSRDKAIKQAMGNDDEEVDEVQDFGPGPGSPLDRAAGPFGVGPDRIPNTGVPDKKNYKAPLSDKYGWKPGSAAGGHDATGQQKYIDRTAPGVINKIKDKLGYDMPDTDYGPRPDERERLVKRYPAPIEEAEVDECGLPGMSNMPSGMMGMSNKQQDSVSMNLSMNGSGSGGIRDLMAILKNIESGDHSHDDIELPGMGDMDSNHKPSIMISKDRILGDENKQASPAGFDQASTSPDPFVFQGNFPTDTGDDLHKPKNSYSDKPYRGDNPMAVEGIKNRLDRLYQEVKSR